MPRCIEFYYHMKGKDMGHLNVYIEPYSFVGDVNMEKPQLVWTHGAERDDEWNYMQKQARRHCSE